MESIPAVAGASAFAPDLVFTVIASAFGGALLTAVITLVVFILNGRREHKKWLNDLKYETYVAQLAPLEGLKRLIDSGDKSDEASTKLSEIRDSISGVNMSLIASFEVAERYADVLNTIAVWRREGDNTEGGARQNVVLAMERLINSMRHDLMVPAKQTVKTRHLR